jgi:hypothetical protein
MRRPRGCVRLGAQRQQLDTSRSPYCSRLRLAPGPYRITLRHHYFNCVLCQSLPQRPRKPAAYGACWAVEQPSAADSHHHLAVSNVRGAAEAR